MNENTNAKEKQSILFQVLHNYWMALALLLAYTFTVMPWLLKSDHWLLEQASVLLAILLIVYFINTLLSVETKPAQVLSVIAAISSVVMISLSIFALL